LIYGYPKEKIKELKDSLTFYKDGYVLCLACYQERGEKADVNCYYSMITHSHLQRKHKEEFGDKEKPTKHYKKIYSGASLMGKDMIQKIYHKDPSDKYKEISAHRIKKSVAEAGGLGAYSQDQLLVLYEKTLQLADIYEKEGKHKLMLDALKTAEKIINNTAPSKANIPGENYTKKATPEDNEALDKLDTLLPFIAKDVEEIKNKNVSQKVLDGWTDPEDKRD
jgi:hypothetical protein